MKKFGIIAASFALPFIASAQISDVWSIFGFINKILNTLLPLIIAGAVVYFIYGVAMYIIAGGEEAKEAAKTKIVWGIIGLFVMISVWGLVNILVNTFGLDNTNRAQNVQQQLPAVPNTR
jgi:NADH:ubiquinone oxidoreductase subunit 6 (subunit J)